MYAAFVNNFDLLMALAFFLLFFLGFFAFGLRSFFLGQVSRGFKILVSVLVLVCVFYVVVFFGLLGYIVFYTSFLKHISDGDLFLHLAKGL